MRVMSGESECTRVVRSTREQRAVKSIGNHRVFRGSVFPSFLAVALSVAALLSASSASAVMWNGLNWTQWSGNGHWYALFSKTDDDAQPWDFAYRQAVGIGAYLATVTSAEEESFIASTYPMYVGGAAYGTYWIGLTRDSEYMGGTAGTDGFGWVTDETEDYRNWIYGLTPDLSAGDYVTMAYGGGRANPQTGWNAVPIIGDHPRHAVFERDYMVPEPSLGLLLLLGIVPLGIAVRRRRPLGRTD